MPRPNSLVARIEKITDVDSFDIASFRHSIQTPLPTRPRVVISGDRPLRFDPALTPEMVAAKLSAAKSLEMAGYPGYLELTEKGEILDIRIPEVGKITRLRPIAGGRHELALDESDSMYFIEADFDKHELAMLAASLKSGETVAVVRGPNQRLFDFLAADAVKPTTPPLGSVRKGKMVINDTDVLKTPKLVQNLFDKMAAESCPLPTPTAGCIPFAYVATGCFAKAHRMCELMADLKITAAKIWSFGSLNVQTKNLSKCSVGWASHVAPFVRVSSNSKPLIRVIDPSMFTEPVPVARWIRAQNDPNAVVCFSDAEVFRLISDGVGRLERPASPALARETDWFLETHAECLRQMANGKRQPPPFAKC